MVESIQKRGVLAGIPKGVWRILRCNPFCAGGYDPVERDPEKPPLPWETRLEYEARVKDTEDSSTTPGDEAE